MLSNVSEYIPNNAIYTFFKVLKEDLFDNQVLPQLLIISSILVILMCDSGFFCKDNQYRLYNYWKFGSDFLGNQFKAHSYVFSGGLQRCHRRR